MNLDRLTISGFRGLLGTELTDETVVLLVKAFIDPLLVSPLAGGESHNKKQTNKLHILIGRDGRESGIHIEEIIVKTLVENGINVTVGGILTTPSVLYLTKTLTFDAGIIITASHNPIEYNGLKFVNNDGFFVSHEFIQKMKDGINLGDMVPNNESVMGEIIYDSTLAKRYTDHIISSFSKLKTKMRVIVDPVNSSGSIMSPEFLRGLGCEVIMINDEPIGIFARQAEPNPQALLELGRATLGYAMDIGFGLDPDGDRLALVDENGIPVFEEYTLALCAKAVYEKLKKENVLSSAGPLVINFLFLISHILLLHIMPVCILQKQEYHFHQLVLVCLHQDLNQIQYPLHSPMLHDPILIMLVDSVQLVLQKYQLVHHLSL